MVTCPQFRECALIYTCMRESLTVFACLGIHMPAMHRVMPYMMCIYIRVLMHLHALQLINACKADNLTLHSDKQSSGTAPPSPEPSRKEISAWRMPMETKRSLHACACRRSYIPTFLNLSEKLQAFDPPQSILVEFSECSKAFV